MAIKKKWLRLTDQIFWENRKIYIELFEQYLSSKMDIEEVLDYFFRLQRNHIFQISDILVDPERVQKIQITFKSEGFADLIDLIFLACDLVDVEKTDKNSPDSLTENFFRNYVRLRLQELKDYDYD